MDARPLTIFAPAERDEVEKVLSALFSAIHGRVVSGSRGGVEMSVEGEGQVVG